MKTWHELLLDKTYVLEEAAPFGRNGHQICAAIDAVHSIDWFAHVGEPIDATIVVLASSWEAVSDVVHASWSAGYCGIFEKPASLYSADMDAVTHSQYVAAYEASRDAFDYFPYLPTELSEQDRELANSYLRSWSELLFCEILLSDRIDCTYFREQLQWFHAGHFPCGWEGEWPVGKMRVF